MFNFFNKKKKINAEEIKAFDWAIKAIEIYIALSEWSKAKKAIDEIKVKEKESLTSLLEKISLEKDQALAEKQKKKETKEYKKKEKKITSLKNKIEKLEAKYIKNAEKERFKIRFSKIKDEIDILIWAKRGLQAMSLLQKFLEENKENTIVVKFYNSEKKVIQKSIDNQRKAEQDKLKNNAKKEALTLIWKTANIDELEEESEDDKKAKTSFSKLKEKLNFYSKLKERIKKKKLLDEINLLIEEDTKVNDDLAAKKLENIHRWLVKELTNNKLRWYDIYGKILWVSKISGDTFGIEENKNKYLYFIWDATGHWIRAWFIITLMTRLFKENISKPLQELAFNMNNGLKQDLKSRNFVTSIFFEIDKESKEVAYTWMWHEPILIYRKKEKKIEKIIPWGLAAWIRIIKNKEDVKVNNIKLSDWDVLMTYSDGVLENKSIEWETYWLEKLEESFKLVSENQSDIKAIYEYIINDIKLFKGWSNFEDDATVIVLRRDATKDIIDVEDEYITELKAKEWLKAKDIKKLKWKTKEEIEKELDAIRREKETERILKILENLYYTWEILKLKEEAIRFIKKWFIHKKINHYLKKAIDNEKKYKVEQKNQKMEIKYNILKELYKKWDYSTVIKEVEDIIGKDWNI